jgi:hypothetical protein
MIIQVAILHVLSLSFAIGALFYYGRRSLRSRRVVPELQLCVGLMSVAWLEAPYDWATYASFNPDFPTLPRWGPFVTHGGMPILTPFGYALYFLGSSLLAVAIAKRVSVRFGWNRVWSILCVGLAFGFLWDVSLEVLGTWIDIWKYGRAAPGLVLFPNSDHQHPLYISFAMAIFIMGCAYFIGRTDDQGRTFLQSIARHRIQSRRRKTALTLIGPILYVHIIFLVGYVPIVITKIAQMQTVVSDTPLYERAPDFPLNPP